jgi:hypothetical protein
MNNTVYSGDSREDCIGKPLGQAGYENTGDVRNVKR